MLGHQHRFHMRSEFGECEPLANRTHRREQTGDERLRIVERRLQLLHTVHQLQRRRHISPLQSVLRNRSLQRRSELRQSHLLRDRADRRQHARKERLGIFKRLLQVFYVCHGLDHRQYVLPSTGVPRC